MASFEEEWTPQKLQDLLTAQMAKACYRDVGVANQKDQFFTPHWTFRRMRRQVNAKKSESIDMFPENKEFDVDHCANAQDRAWPKSE